MAELTVMVGLDGSGREDCARGLGEVAHAEEEAFALLRQGRDAVLDAPNLRSRTRRGLAQRAAAMGCPVRAVLVAAPLETCLRAQPGREEALCEQRRSFSPPQEWEGFDEVQLVYPAGGPDLSLHALFFGEQGLMFLSQDCPFHAHSVGKHCALAARNCARLCPDDSALWLAALLHDIGKAQTKAFLDSHGQPSPSAHFYGHEHVSAYESLFVRFPAAVPERERLRVSALAAWHMQPASFGSERTRERYLRLWGEDFFRDVMAVAWSDRLAMGKE